MDPPWVVWKRPFFEGGGVQVSKGWGGGLGEKRGSHKAGLKLTQNGIHAHPMWGSSSPEVGLVLT